MAFDPWVRLPIAELGALAGTFEGRLALPIVDRGGEAGWLLELGDAFECPGGPIVERLVLPEADRGGETGRLSDPGDACN